MSYVIAFHALAGIVLLVVGLLALTAQKSRRSIHPRLGEAYFWVLVITLSSALVVGARDPAISIFEIVTPPTFLLGLLGYVMVKRKPRRWLGRPWLMWHIVGQSGSYIGAVTAASFQIFPRFLPPHELLTASYWLVPSLIGSLLIRRTIRKWMRRPVAAG